MNQFRFPFVTCALLVCLVFLTGALSNHSSAAAKKKSSGAKKGVEVRRQTGLWQPISKENAKLEGSRLIDADTFLLYRVNKKALLKELNKAPLEFTDAARVKSIVLEVPTPDGGRERFVIQNSPILAPEIAAQFPTWKTFQGQGVEDPTAVARFDINHNGFHGYVIGARGTYLINPYSEKDQQNYIVYYKSDLSDDRPGFSCRFEGGMTEWGAAEKDNAPVAFTNGTQLRTFRLAVSASKQYTNYFNGDKTAAFAAIQTTVNRIIAIYRRELATTFTLVSGTNTVFTNADDGGFTNNSNSDSDRNQIVLDEKIGKTNYDIGHILSVTPNPDGIASSPSLCNDNAKAQGFTGAPKPVGDGFDVDYVAHEIGHQFGMSHTFNNSADGSCTTRSADSAFEPASGITIMGYGGICAPRNLAANSIEYFHARSFVQTLEYLPTVAACGTTVATGNTPPANVSAGANYTIPKQTPFMLTASAQDTDALTYSWEQYDLGQPTASNGAVDTDEDGVARPLFRSYNPTTEPFRLFPSLHYILNNANVPPLTYSGKLPLSRDSRTPNGDTCAAGETCVTGERLPSMARTMNFRVTVRDNNAAGGGVADASAQVTIDAASGPFRLTTQDATPAVWQIGAQQNVTWDVANTNNAPVNAQNVKISLSTDGGNTFPIVLADSTPNNGARTITVPNNPTTQARIKVEAVGNVFFDINNSNFTIAATAAAPAVTIGGRVLNAEQQPINDARVTLTDPQGATRTASTNQAGEYRFADVTAGLTYTISVEAKRSVFRQPSQTISVTENRTDINFVADPPQETPNERNSKRKSSIKSVFSTIGKPVAAERARTFSNTAPITINDDAPASPYPSNITVTDLPGMIARAPGSVRVTINRLSHTFPEDIGIVLVAPNGAALLLQNGVTDGTDGNPASNITYTISDAASVLMPSDSALVDGMSYKPTAYFTGDDFPAPGPGTNYANPGPADGGAATLASVFGGINPNGVWKLYVADFIAGDTGTIAGGWTLSITTDAIANVGKTVADFDGDGKTDVSVFRPATGVWQFINSSSQARGSALFGQNGDRIVPADYDADGRTDFAVFRNGIWYLSRSTLGFAEVRFGLAEDIPVPADFDGDNRADIAVFRPSTGFWYYLRSSDGGFRAVRFGQTGDKPVIGDFDNDGKADIAVYRPGQGTWFYLRSSDGGFRAVQFGIAEDKPVPADFDGDGATDIAVFRPSTGFWYYLRSSDGGFRAVQFGVSTDQPAPGDYDGDGKADAAVFRPSARSWYVLQSGTNSFAAFTFGTDGDVAVPSAYIY